MAPIILNYVIDRPETREWLKRKAHDWLPAYFERYDLTPEENLLLDQKNCLQAALAHPNKNKLAEVLDLFPHLINQPLNNGEIPITFAAKQGLHDKIDMLLAKGADPTCKDRIGLNALDIALQKQEKQLFAKLIANKYGKIAGADQFIETLDSIVVTGSDAKNELKSIAADAKKAREELEEIKLPSEEKKLFLTILKGDFVQFKQIATSEKVLELSKKIDGDQLIKAAILGSPLILDAMLSMGFQPPELKCSSSEHPMRFALCSRHPIEAYIPLFNKFNFDIHSWASPKENIKYFDLLVYQKMQNAQNMDPLAVTVWDVAFAAFSLLSFAANYQYIPIPLSYIPWVRSGLNTANYLQTVSLLLFKLSYAREGKVSSALQQLMTHYVASLFLPVRLYYASMTVYSGWRTCMEHKYRSYKDLFKKMIIQLPAAAEIAHHTTEVATPYFKGFYNRLFGIVETRNYNWNTPSTQNQGTQANPVVVSHPKPRQMLENTDFMKSFGENSLNAVNAKSGNSQGNSGITGQMFNNEKWLHEGNTPKKVTTASAAIEFGKDFHRNTEWFKNAIQGTPLEKAYHDMHLQAAASGQLKEYRNGFSVQAGFRVDFTGLSALEHFVETVVGGGAHFEKINNLPAPAALPSGYTEIIS